MAWEVQEPMKDTQGYFRISQVKAILEATLNSRFPDKEMMHLLFKVLFQTGRRISEVIGQPPYNKVVGLRPMDIILIEEEDPRAKWFILKKNPIRIDKKLKKALKKAEIKEYLQEKRIKIKVLPRTLPLRISISKDLIRYIQVNELEDDERIFPITRFRANYVLKDVCKKIGIHTIGDKKPHLHCFRHAFSMNIAKKTKSVSALRELQRLLQHSDISVTQQYLSVGNEDLRETLNLLEDV